MVAYAYVASVGFVAGTLSTTLAHSAYETVRDRFRGDGSEPPLMPGPPLYPNPKAHDVPTQPIRPQMPAPVPPKGGRS